MRARVWIMFVLGGLLSALAYAVTSQQVVQELWWQVVTFGSAGAVLLGLRVHAPANRRPWLLVFAALLTFALMGLVGMSSWGWPEDHPVWPLRDVGLMAGFVLVGAATLGLARARVPEGDPEGLIDGLIVMVAAAAVLWDTVFGPLAQDSAGNLAAQARLVVFPLLQAGVAAAALRLLFLGTVGYPSAWMIFGAALMACTGNVVWVLEGGGLPGLLVNELWISSFLLAGAAVLHPSMRDLATPASADALRLPLGRLVVLGVALLSLPATVLHEDGGGLGRPSVTVFAAALCVGLVVWRLGRLIHQRERVSAALGRRAARAAALARISEHALVTTDADVFLAEAAGVVRTTMDAQACEVVSSPEDPRAEPAERRTVIPLRNWLNGEAALVVDLAPGKRLDLSDQEFLRAVANILAGAVQRLRMETEMRHQALHDALTGLPNRILLVDRLDQALSRLQRSEQTLSVLFADLDNFKQVNDSFGHSAGDELLVEAARRLERVIRPQDTLARMSGDEFVVVCEEADGVAAVAVADRVVAELSRPFELGAGRVVLSASVGVVSTAKHARGRDQLLHDADAAMYRGKQLGRNRVEVFDEDLRERLSWLDGIERDLRGAHDRGEFALVFQPIVALGDAEDRVVAVEALLRWNHPRDGLILPGEFIAVAENRGLIVPLGDWVLRAACQQIALWKAGNGGSSPLSVAINVSAHQLTDPGLVSRFASTLADYGVPPQDVIVELTETALGQDGSRIVEVLNELREMGVRVALDDFGTGYSSLTHLRTMPLDILKVDGSFVAGLAHQGREEAIVSALAGLAQELGVTVVAEGVETAEQLVAARALRFDLVQGFHLGRPSSAEDLGRALGFGGRVPELTRPHPTGGGPGRSLSGQARIRA